MRLIHPTTRHGARDAFGRRHNALIVTGPFWLAGLAVLAVWAGYAHITADDKASSAKQAGRVAKPAKDAAAAAGDRGLPLLAIGAVGLLFFLLLAGLLLAKSRRDTRRLELDLDRLESPGADWSSQEDEEERNQDTTPIPLRSWPNKDDAA